MNEEEKRTSLVTILVLVFFFVFLFVIFDFNSISLDRLSNIHRYVGRSILGFLCNIPPFFVSSYRIHFGNLAFTTHTHT